MARRSFTREFRESAARLVTEQGYSAPQAAQSIGVHPHSIRDWVKKFTPAPIDSATAPPEGLAALRREVAPRGGPAKRLCQV